MKKRLLASMIAMALSGSILANETSSSLRGKITGPQGDAAANTTIIILHVPTGTRKTVTTSATGSFNAKGLRVGGPYKVTIDSDEFADQEYSDIFLQLGQVERLNAQLEDTESNTLVITGTRIPSTLSNGSSTIFGVEAIKNQSGITRDIKDVVRANPLVSIGVGASAPMSIAGMNPKFNSFTVDGISQNDDFGLSDGGYPTVRSPIPIDALEQITIEAAPFDAKVSGFSGGLINAVLKSGTNELHGSVFYEKLDSGWGGTPRNSALGFDGEVIGDVDIEFEETTWGFGLDGAIIKDKLFFSVYYENYESPQTLEFGAAGSGAANETEATLAEVAEVQRIAREVYGLTDEQIGSASGSPVEEDEKYTIKLDLNISDEHRASFTYQYNLGNRTRNTTSSTGELRFSSHWYNQSEELNNFSVKLYSDWSENFSSEISITSKSVANRQNSFGDFADVTVDNLPSGGQIAFGSDRFRHANKLDTGTDTFKFDAVYDMGEHSIGFGIDYQNISIQNLFVPSSKGVIVFDSLTDFENRLADSYTYSNGTGNDPAAVGADFDRQTLAFYVQDNWDVSDQLTVNLGLRYEVLSSDEKPPFNANSQARTGFDNSENLDGLSIILPRASFNYEFSDELSFRGGFGRFSGGQPNVWISNAYSENGVNEGFFRVFGETITADSILNVYGPAFAAIQDASNDGNVSFTDPNFKLPSDWRYNFAADYEFDIPFLGEGFRFMSEVIYIDKIDQAFWIDASLHDADVTVAADGQRLLYADNNDNRYDLMLTNTNIDGKSLILIQQLQKAWDNGVSFTFSYTNTDITDVNPGTSSTARSNYRFSTGINRNDPAGQLGRSAFEIEHSIKLNLGYNTEIFEGYSTNINMYFERRSGNPISHTTNFDRNLIRSTLAPEFTSGNFTSYIPTLDDPNVVYIDTVDRNGNVTSTAAENQAAVEAAIEARGLSRYAGGYAPKGSGTTPWVNNLDLSINQEIPGLFDGHKGRITFVIDNLLNLIDSSKGKVVDNRFGTSRLYDVDSIDAQGRYLIDGVRNDGNRFNAYESTWKLKLGVSYSF